MDAHSDGPFMFEGCGSTVARAKAARFVFTLSACDLKPNDACSVERREFSTEGEMIHYARSMRVRRKCEYVLVLDDQGREYAQVYADHVTRF